MKTAAIRCACRCLSAAPICLNPEHSEAPFVCMSCGCRVMPARLRLPVALHERIAEWAGLYRSYFVLWLKSAACAPFVEGEISSWDSALNQEALKLVRCIAPYRKAYYWWFQNEYSQRPAAEGSCCPGCGASLASRCRHWVCDACLVALG